MEGERKNRGLQRLKRPRDLRLLHRLELEVFSASCFEFLTKVISRFDLCLLGVVPLVSVIPKRMAPMSYITSRSSDPADTILANAAVDLESGDRGPERGREKKMAPKKRSSENFWE